MKKVKYRAAEDLLIEEYKMAIEQEQKIENNIWNSASIIGVGNIASIFVSTLSIKSVSSILCIGMLTTSFTWIWWNIAKRWWDIQHTITLRKRHIEERTSIRIQTYIGIRDEIVRSSIEEKVKAELGDTNFIELKNHDRQFKKRGVRQYIRFIAPIVTFIWAYILIYTLYIKGVFSMNISNTLVAQIMTYIGFIGIGFGIGISVGGKKENK